MWWLLLWSGVVDALGVRLVVDQRRTRRDRLDLVEYRGEDLVGDLDAPAGLFGDPQRLGRHGRHAVAYEADLVVEADLVPRRGVRPGLTARGVLHPWRVAVVDHGVHAGQRPGLAVVDGQDASVCVRAAQHLGIQHVAQVDVVGEDGPSLGETQGVDLGLGLSDHCRAGDVARQDDVGHGKRGLQGFR